MEKNELNKYKNIIKQGLIIREASRILKIVADDDLSSVEKAKRNRR